ncbi:MAG: hypothetical protein FJ038_12485 [Chloroflexi bacterium]|nr:hypothetical protein [Chloroflexota bacterium]
MNANLTIRNSLDALAFLRAANVDGSEPCQIVLGLARTEGETDCWTICGAAVRGDAKIGPFRVEQIVDLAGELDVSAVILAEVGDTMSPSWVDLRDGCATHDVQVIDYLCITATDFISSRAAHENQYEPFDRGELEP